MSPIVTKLLDIMGKQLRDEINRAAGGHFVPIRVHPLLFELLYPYIREHNHPIGINAVRLPNGRVSRLVIDPKISFDIR